MDKHTIKCNTETRRNKEQVKNIKHIVPPNPKEKQGTLNADKTPKGNDQELPSMVTNSVTEKNSYGLGCTTTDREIVEINPFPRDIKHLTLKDLETYLIPDG